MKKRNWACVFYPESLPSDWLDRLQQKGIAFCVSPLHNQDVNPDGTIKKDHYHVILCFDGPTTDKNVKSITTELNQPIPIPLESVRGYYRYLTHKDNPEKYQYNEEEIRSFNGFDSLDLLSNSEISSLLRDIQDIINKNGLIEYSDLMDYLRDLSFDYWKVASNHTLFLNTYLTSKRHSSTIKLDS